MLVLSRKIGERVLIGDDISITVVRVSSGGVRLGIMAPSGMTVMREELRIDIEPEEAGASGKSATVES